LRLGAAGDNILIREDIERYRHLGQMSSSEADVLFPIEEQEVRDLEIPLLQKLHAAAMEAANIVRAEVHQQPHHFHSDRSTLAVCTYATLGQDSQQHYNQQMILSAENELN
jgi:hypothetical protein